MVYINSSQAVLKIATTLVLILMLLPCNPFLIASALAQESVKGIDVSHYQSDKQIINWSQVRNAGYTFAFIKATDGTGFVDPFFVRHMDGARAAGLLVSAYHFARPNRNSAQDEAHYFVSFIKGYLKSGHLRPALDIEDTNDGLGGTAGMSVAELSNWIQEWMTAVITETGIEPILYISASYAAPVPARLDHSLTRYDLWIADPNNNPPKTGMWTAWMFWQYGVGSVPGITAPVDLDLFNGTEDKLQFLCHAFTSDSTVQQGFGVPWDVFNTSRVLLRAVCNSVSIPLAIPAIAQIGPATYVYSQGYAWDGTKWNQIAFTCTAGALVSNAWCPTSAQGRLPANSTYYVGYTCNWTGTKWNCGCADQSCSQGFWQLQKIQR